MIPMAIGLKSCRIAVRNERNQRLKQEHLQPVKPISVKKAEPFLWFGFFYRNFTKKLIFPLHPFGMMKLIKK